MRNFGGAALVGNLLDKSSREDVNLDPLFDKLTRLAMPDGSYLFEYDEFDSDLGNTELVLMLYQSFGRTVPKHLFNNIIPLVQLRNNSVSSSKPIDYPFYPQIFASVVALSEKLPKFEVHHLLDLTVCFLSMLRSNEIKLVYDAAEALRIITTTYHKYQPLYFHCRKSAKDAESLEYVVYNALNATVLLPKDAVAQISAHLSLDDGTGSVNVLSNVPMKVSGGILSLSFIQNIYFLDSHLEPLTSFIYKL